MRSVKNIPIIQTSFEWPLLRSFFQSTLLPRFLRYVSQVADRPSPLAYGASKRICERLELVIFHLGDLPFDDVSKQTLRVFDTPPASTWAG
jgi:hypothetical protein